ncbi:MAG: hypothetical protein FJ298_16055 [Planctomycetes bacterium]|nr:hypothetical protein [Planctomycetota bacterium]
MVLGMVTSHAVAPMAVGEFGERLSSLRLYDGAALEGVRRSLEAHGQLTAVVAFMDGDRAEILDGFKRVRAARVLGWDTLAVRVVDANAIDAKLQLCALHGGRGLTEIEEAWVIRSLHRDHGIPQPEIARRLGCHKSWVWRRLMLVESLDVDVQSDVRLGVLAARAAVAISRLPRGNQRAASRVVTHRGLTVRQTELLVDEVLSASDEQARAAMLARRLEGEARFTAPGPKPSRAVRNEAEWMGADVLRVRDIAARLEARLLARPLETFPPAATELLRDALLRLAPVLRSLERVITRVSGHEGIA